uniref:THAP-type domain-containing protein n=1 Tax=Macrostomum lignano TaxID=282301 RepID=A0A1I8H379_9PLAT
MNSNVKTSFHAFPLNDPQLMTEWLRRIRREHYAPTKESRLCSAHFLESDFISTSQDSNTRRKRKRNAQLSLRVLRKGAIPSVFPQLPERLQPMASTSRTESATAELRHQAESDRLETAASEFLSLDKVGSLEEIKTMLESNPIPVGFVPVFGADSIAFCLIDVEDVPNLVCSIQNLLALAKSWGIPDPNPRSAEAKWIEAAIDCLCNLLEESNDSATPLMQQIQFIVEQLRLRCQAKEARRYSPGLIVFAMVLKSTSSACYQVLLDQDLLVLPSVRRLTAISSPLIDYSSGSIVGMQEANPASTMLCFMVKSIAGKYRDVVALFPLSKLTAEILHEHYTSVMGMLQRTNLNVVTILVDNHSANRAFFVHKLCGGILQTCVPHPFHREKKIFLLFDPTHTIKNVYNNFQKRQSLELPAKDSAFFNVPLPHVKRTADSLIVAKFENIKELYNLEQDKPLKLAPKLNSSVIDPKSIQKTSPKLALAVFSESTAHALEYYSANQGKPWGDTATFVHAVTQLWKVLNVKTSSIGKHKRDCCRDPVRSDTDWKLTYLADVANYLREWKACRSKGLSDETFLALSHTLDALVEVCRYLLNSLMFEYVLVGAFQSDPLEGRFGWYRHRKGLNYYVSCKDVLDAAKDLHSESSDLMEEAGQIADQLNLIEEIEAADANVTYYVAGKIAKSITAQRSCTACNQLLVATPDESAAEAPSDFLRQLDRGGLTNPSDLVFTICKEAWVIIMQLQRCQRFLKSRKSHGSFCCALGCSNNSSMSPAVSFHFFPKDTEMKRKWLVALRRKEFKPSATTQVCSVHFAESCFKEQLAGFLPTTRRRLYPNAVPSIFPTLPDRLQPVEKKRKTATAAAAAAQEVDFAAFLKAPECSKTKAQPTDTEADEPEQPLQELHA